MAKLLSTILLAFAAAAPALALAQNQDAEQGLIKRGAYLAVAGDCAACHTVSGRPAYSGGLPIQSPLGSIYSTNITPSSSAGIGGYTLEQFGKALRQGVRKDGSNLYPAMPYTSYAKLTDEDVAALYAYFMHGVPASDDPAPRTALPFPFNLRVSLAAWNALFLDDQPFKPVAGQSAQWLRGAYLVQGLAHCSTCHTPRNALMAEKSDQFLAGASLGAWYAPNITPDMETGIGRWQRDDLVSYLMTGHAANGATAAGPMLEAIDKSFSKLDKDDVQAMAVYLQSVPAVKTESARRLPDSAPVPASDVAEMTGRIAPGAALYRDNCASCHRIDGKGARGLPSLVGNSSLSYPTADNVAMAILNGAWPESGQGMPGFATQLSDQDIAELANYVVASFGHRATTLDAQRVAALRQGGAPSPMLRQSRIGMGAVVVLLIAGMALLARRRRRQAQG